MEVYELFTQLCPRILPVTIADTDRAKAILKSRKDVGVRDAIHAAVALNNDVSNVVTYDRGFDDIPGIVRVEPEGLDSSR